MIKSNLLWPQGKNWSPYNRPLLIDFCLNTFHFFYTESAKLCIGKRYLWNCPYKRLHWIFKSSRRLFVFSSTIKPNLSWGRDGKPRVLKDSRVAYKRGSSAFFVYRTWRQINSLEIIEDRFGMDTDTAQKKNCIWRWHYAELYFWFFFKKSPISVMTRAMLERVLNPDQLTRWFDAT